MSSASGPPALLSEPSLYGRTGLLRGLRVVVNVEAVLLLFQVVFCAQSFGSSLLVLSLAPLGIGAWGLVCLARVAADPAPGKTLVYLVWKLVAIFVYAGAALAFTVFLGHLLVLGAQSDDQAADEAQRRVATGSFLQLGLFAGLLYALFGTGVWFFVFVIRVRRYLRALASREGPAIFPTSLRLPPDGQPPAYVEVAKWETPPPTYEEAASQPNDDHLPPPPPPPPTAEEPGTAAQTSSDSK